MAKGAKAGNRKHRGDEDDRDTRGFGTERRNLTGDSFLDDEDEAMDGRGEGEFSGRKRSQEEDRNSSRSGR
jgi:hypothetical protein